MRKQVVIIGNRKALVIKGSIITLTIMKNLAGGFMINIASPLFDSSGLIPALNASLFLFAAEDYVEAAYNVKHNEFKIARRIINIFKSKDKMRRYGNT